MSPEVTPGSAGHSMISLKLFLMLQYHIVSTTPKGAFPSANSLMSPLRGSPPECDGSPIKQISPDLVSNSNAGHWDLLNKKPGEILGGFLLSVALCKILPI